VVWYIITQTTSVTVTLTVFGVFEVPEFSRNFPGIFPISRYKRKPVGSFLELLLEAMQRQNAMGGRKRLNPSVQGPITKQRLSYGNRQTVRKIIRDQQEKKQHFPFTTDPGDAAGLVLTNVSTTPLNYVLNNIPQAGGVTAYNDAYHRSGNQVKVSGFYLRGTIKAPTLTQSTGSQSRGSNDVRIVIYERKPGSDSLTVSTTASINMNMYIVHYDQLFSVSNAGGPSVQRVLIKKAWKKGLDAQWTPSSSTSSGSQTVGKLELMIVADVGNDTQWEAESRLWFTDS